MWPWKRSEVPAEAPDELLGAVQRGVIAALGSLQQQIHTLANQMKLLDESASDARKLETRLHKVDTLATATRQLLEGELARVDVAINQVRGQATGMSRGGRRNREAEEIGAALIEMLGPERSQQLVAEISERTSSSNGAPQANDVFA